MFGMCNVFHVLFGMYCLVCNVWYVMFGMCNVFHVHVYMPLDSEINILYVFVMYCMCFDF